MQIQKPAIGEPCNGCGLCCRIEICSTGSMALGLVSRYGDRAPGPCPALEDQGAGRFGCGLLVRPKHYMAASSRSVTALREAIKLMIGAGAGCDEAGDEPDATAGPKIDAIGARYIRRHGAERLVKARKVIFG